MLPSIVSAPHAVATPAIDRACFEQLLSHERCCVAFGQPCSQALMQGVHEAIKKIDKGFFSMLEVTLYNVGDKLSAWFAAKPLGELSPSLERELKADIERDVIGFIQATNACSVTLRLLLETSSGFDELYEVVSETCPERACQRIVEIAGNLEYERAYRFHYDSEDNVVNQIKSYCGATTLAVDPCDIEAELNFTQWSSLFFGEGSLSELAAEAIAKKDTHTLDKAIQVTIERAWRYQTELPGLAKPGSSPYRFLLGTPHLYFGAPEELKPFSTILEKPSLHARPLIWANDPGAKRFLTLLDSPSDFSLSAR